jgi:hypothetical protein
VLLLLLPPPLLLLLLLLLLRNNGLPVNTPSLSACALPPNGIGHELRSCCHCGLSDINHLPVCTPCRYSQGV